MGILHVGIVAMQDIDPAGVRQVGDALPTLAMQS
jgi:hypothetical protein